jgi:hypothetical protein
MTPKPMTEPEEIAHVLRTVHDGDPWHGPSRAALLADVTAEVAAWDPGAGAHGIWQQVLHMRNWTREVAARTMGKRPSRSDPVGGDWPGIGDPSEEAWQETLASLDAAHREMVAVVLALPVSRLHEYVGATAEKPTGSGVSVGTMLRSLAEHDLYHCGQVSLLKRLARGALGLTQS